MLTVSRRPPPSPGVRPLREALAQHLDWQNQRLTFLAQFLLALFQVRTVNLAELATALSPRAKTASNYKRLQRFLRSFELDYVVIARLLVRLLPVGQGPWYLTLDRTNWKFGQTEINLLVLGIAHQGIALPLFWTVLPTAGNSSTAERVALIKRFLSTFGVERIAALLADREFVGQDWFRWLQSEAIPFRLRLKHNTLIPNRWNVPTRAAVLCRSLAPGQFCLLPGRRPVWGCFVHLVALRLADGQLLLLATSDQPEQALADYRRRWEIESLFGCLKSRGFRFEDTHLTDPERIAKLVALLAIAFAWTYEVGAQRQGQEPIPFKKLSSGPSCPSSATASIISAPSSSTSPVASRSSS